MAMNLFWLMVIFRPNHTPSASCDGNPASSYLLLDTDALTATFRRVAYDMGVTQRLMRDLDLPMRLVERLSWGR